MIKLRTPISAWSTTFFATLGLTPLVACSSSDHVGNSIASSGGAATTGGSTSTGGISSGGSPGSGGTQATGGAAGKGGTGGSIGTGGTAGTSSGGSSGMGGASGGSAGAAGSATGGADAGSDGADAGHLACRNPMPRLGPDGKPTGFVDCEGGFTHRPEKRTCSSTIPRSTGCTNANPQFTGNCTHDSDCTTQPLGYCQLSSGPAAAACACHYGCTTDAECGAGEICGCADPVGACVPTQNCKSDADCGPGLLCITSSDGGCGYTFACQTPKDTCTTSADCDVSSMCAFVVDHHECTQRHPCSTGRPFLVAGSARVASIANTRAWSSHIAPCMADLDAGSRAALAAHWTEIALMEHASIAAFARFALELLSLGAPAELLNRTHAALADETIHARDAFALASAYSGEAIGPGPLSMVGAMDARSFADIVETAVVEGCIGETVAALEATEALAFANDEAVCAALGRVAQDEARHAELAYRFVRWALEVSPKATRTALGRRIFELLGAQQRDASEGTGRDSDAPLLARHGLLSAHRRATIRTAALAEVVAPCLAALVAQTLTDVAHGAGLGPVPDVEATSASV